MFGIDLSPTLALGGLGLSLFVLGQVLSQVGRARPSRRVLAAGWVVFAAFWVAMLPIFWVEMRSLVETALGLLAVPLCLVAARAQWRERQGMGLLTRAVGVTGLLYGVAVAIPPVQHTLVAVVSDHTEAGIRALGYDVVRRHSAESGVASEFVFTRGGREYVTFIVLACTGIGAMSVFAGIVAAVEAPLRRKLRALSVVVAVVWLLNVVRNVFIAVAFGGQWFQADPLVALTRSVGYTDPHLASYFVADRVLAQSLSVLALVALGLLLLRLLPETRPLFETLLSLVSGGRYGRSTDARS